MNVEIISTGAWNYNKEFHDESRYLDVPLADWIVKFLIENKIDSLFDFGCSTGYYLKHISENTTEMNLIGVEPCVTEREDNLFDNILPKDLAVRFDLMQKGSILCLEVLEHIPAQFESVAIDNIENHCDGYLLMSWAVPNQGGYGHFNEKEFADVLRLFESRGFRLMEKETQDARNTATLPWLKNNFSVFKKI